MNKACPIQVPNCPELPTSNYSAEDPDVPFWIGEAGRGFGGGGDLWGKAGCLQMWCYSTVSQEAANECAALQDLFCGDDGDGGGGGGGTFTNTEQTCTATCGAATISFTQPAGTVGSTTSQADADAKAHALACDKVNCKRIFFTCGAMPNGCVDQAYFFHFSADGGTPPYIFNVISGAQPGGMYLDPGSGDYGGETSFGGFFNFLVRATDAGGAYVEQMFTFELLGIADAVNLPDATTGVVYSHTFTPIGGLGTLSWAFGSGTPPPGMILDPITGILGGVCVVPDTYSFKVAVTDTIGTNTTTCSKDFVLKVTSGISFSWMSILVYTPDLFICHEEVAANMDSTRLPLEAASSKTIAGNTVSVSFKSHNLPCCILSE